MATPTVLDVDRVLDPIPGENPSGKNLAYEPAYDQLREARRTEDASLQGEWKRKVKTADWEGLIDLGVSLLETETKDLQIAAWITEGLARRHGFAGLRDGFQLLRGLQEKFWETCYPEIDDGDLEPRSAPFLFLDRTLPPLIRTIKLTAGFGEEQYSYFSWQESRATENAGLKNPELMETLIAEGKITGKQFDDAVAQSPRRYYETVAADLQGAADNLKALDASLDERFGREAPGLTNVRRAIEDCRVLVTPILETKRAEEPDPELEQSLADEEAVPDENTADGYAETSESVASAPQRPGRPPARQASGPVSSSADAFERIQAAAAYLREHEPSSPVPFLVIRALRMAEAYGRSMPLDASQCDAPASTVRIALKRLSSEGEWAQLLEQAELALGRPEGAAWLDLHRYALAAMTNDSTDRSTAATACRSFLRAFLADFPELPDAELNDGTSTASAETRNWLRDEILPPAEPEPAPTTTWYEPPPREEHPPSVNGTDTEAEPDAWSSALELARSKRTPEAIDLLRRAMSSASTGRERFLRKLELVEICLMDNRHKIAILFCEDLARQIDDYRLEAWESESLCARVWAAYYRCLRGVGTANAGGERLQEVFGRLCRLDVNLASSLAADFD